MSPALRTPASRLSYDVLVFGPQLGGAVAAALLARRGYRVLAVVHGGVPPAYRDGDFLLPCGPTVLPPLRSMPVAAAVLEELGLSTDVFRALVPLSPPLQILGEKLRLDVARDGPTLAAEMERELGEAGAQGAAAIGRMLDADERDGGFYRSVQPLPAQGLLERWRLRRAIAGHAGVAEQPDLPNGDPTLARSLRELWHFGTFLWDERPPSRASLRPLTHLLRGLVNYPRGALGLAAEIRKRVSAAGGELLEAEGADPPEIEELRLQRGSLVSAKLQGSPHEYRASLFVAATGASDLRNLLPASAAEGKLAALLGGVKPRSSLLTLNLVVGAHGLPPGLGPAALCLPAKADASAVFLQVTPAQAATGAPPPGAHLVQLARQVPAALFHQGEGHLKAALSEMRALAVDFLPFVDRHVLHESSPQLQEESGLAARLRLHPLVEVGLPRQLGVTGLPFRPPCKNLVLASRDVLPGLGLEGEFLAGARAAQLVQKALPKKEILR
ncbi:MAG: phytoene desaturase family protein [Myxococcales bacterium]